MTAELAGITARANEAALELIEVLREYVMKRHIRDRPLGSHQSVAHTLADHWVAAQAVRSAARSASVSGADDGRELALALGATQALLALADDAVRLRGGNGYLVDDPAARSRLEALALARSLGDPEAVAAEVGRRAIASSGVEDRWHDEVAAALDGVWDEQRATDADIRGVLHDPGVHRAVAGRGWLGAFVAHARLTKGLEPLDAFEIAEALTLRGIPIYALNTSAMAAALIRDHGSAHLRERVLPELLAGSAICALGYTEPNAGSDLAALETSATPRPDSGSTLNGVKRFGTLADEAQHVLVLARTDPETKRHRGLTLFAIPMDSEGLSVRSLPTHGGEVTTELRLDGVRAGAEHVIGEVGGGWAVVMSAMRYERNATPWCDLVRLRSRASELATLPRADGVPLKDSDAWCRALGWLQVDIHLGRGLVDELLADNSPIAAVAPSAAKLFCTEALTRAARRLVRAAPPELHGEVPAQRIEAMWRRAISMTIAGGASEVQRDVVAAQALGLPRSG